MSDWAVGDLAVCVNTDDLQTCIPGRRGVAGRRFKLGSTYCVVAVSVHAATQEPVLLLEGQSQTAAARRFRKILPDKHEACESEFVTLLNRIKRKVSA
jgi:hypothetical protein